LQLTASGGGTQSSTKMTGPGSGSSVGGRNQPPASSLGGAPVVTNNRQLQPEDRNRRSFETSSADQYVDSADDTRSIDSGGKIF